METVEEVEKRAPRVEDAAAPRGEDAAAPRGEDAAAPRGEDLAAPQRSRKTVAESRIGMSRLMRPQHGNYAGNVHGGVLLGLMDEVAYLCASRFSESYCVTVGVDRVEFHEPVRVGDQVTLKAAVNAVGRSSMEVGITIVAEDPRQPGTSRRTHRSFFTMVALDDDGRPTTVPSLACESAEDRTWQCEAELRKGLRREYDQKLQEGICAVT